MSGVFINSVLLCIFLALFSADAAKILGIFPSSSKSHYAVGSALFKELARRGHEMTVISFNEEKNFPSNYSYSNIRLSEDARSKAVDFFTDNTLNGYKLTKIMNKIGAGIVEHTLKNPEVQKLIKSNEKFDVVIMDQFVDDGLAFLAHHFEAHRIVFFTGFACAWVNNLVGNPAPPSVVSEILLEFPTYMTFWQRVQNSIFYVFSELNRQFVFFPQQNAIVQKYFPGSKPIYDYLHNVSLVLLNAHESYTDPVVLVPNMKNVGGLHVTPGKGKLPKDLQKFLDDATEGVVYFSMGSNLKSKDLPVHVRDAILRVFSKLNVKILWKWEEDVLPNQPKNVKLQKWLPQQDVLAHPNLKVFITHGGLLSTIEAVYHGIPLLTLPVYADQKTNAATAAQKGYAINIPFLQFEEARFESALKELLENPKYKDMASLRSTLFNDRPLKPLDEAVYWVEYVIRNEGAKHLRVAALKLSWYQYLLLDVTAFLLAILGIVVFTVRFTIRKLLCKKKCTKKVKTK